MNLFLTFILYLMIVLLCAIVHKGIKLLTMTSGQILCNQEIYEDQLDDIKNLSERTLNKATVNGYAIDGGNGYILGQLKKIENTLKETQAKSNQKLDIAHEGTPYHVRMLEILGSERERFLKGLEKQQ